MNARERKEFEDRIEALSPAQLAYYRDYYDFLESEGARPSMLPWAALRRAERQPRQEESEDGIDDAASE